jgi:GNAT superfamily N-acetyltransferase
VPSFKIRRATSKDVELLVRHRHMMFEEMTRPTAKELKVADDSYREWARAMMKGRLLHGYIVTTGSGKVAASGCVWLREVQPSPGRPTGMVPYVLSMYTGPEFRRNGLASMILKEAMAWAKKKGYGKMTLHASSVGRKVYAKLGWKRGWEMDVRFE